MAQETFTYTGAEQTWTVPSGVGEITVYGRGGRAASSDHAGEVEGTLSVTPGETLYIYVGGPGSQPSGGWPDGGDGGSTPNANGHGGAGSSDVRQGGNTRSDRVAVAGGSGGGGDTAGNAGSFTIANGGPGGGSTAGDGGNASVGNASATGGNGGSQTGGGAAGSPGGPTSGSSSAGGTGGASDSGTPEAVGGGGGGGYNGGGGGGADTASDSTAGAGGGGGPNYTGGLTSVTTNSQGSSFDSNGEVVISYTGAPKSPENTSQTINGDDDILVDWDAPSSGDSPDSYEIEVSEDGGAYAALATVSSSTTQYSHTAPTGPDTFRYRVRSVNSVGSSSWSYTATKSTDPALANPTVTGDDIDLSWSNIDDNSGYNVLRAQSSGASAADYTAIATGLSASTTSYSDTQLEDGEQYYYRVEGVYSGTNSLSNEETATTVLSAPTLDSLDRTTKRQLTLNYTLTDDSSDGDVLIERSTDGGSTWTQAGTAGASSTSVTDTGLADGEQYTYRLTRRTDHASSQSGTLAATTILPAPTGVTVADITADQITISWTDNANRGDYRVLVSDDGGATWTTDGDNLGTNATSYTTTHLLDGELYDLAVEVYTEHTSTRDTT